MRAPAAAGYTGGVAQPPERGVLHGLLDEGVARLDVDRAAGRPGPHLPLVAGAPQSDRPMRVAGRGLPAVRWPAPSWTPGGSRTSGGAAPTRGPLGRPPGHARPPGLPRRARGMRAHVRRSAGSPALHELLRFVAAGCQSELETAVCVMSSPCPAVAAPQLRRPRAPPDGPVSLDAAWPVLTIAVEFEALRSTDREVRELDLRSGCRAGDARPGGRAVRSETSQATQECRSRIVAVPVSAPSCPPAGHFCPASPASAIAPSPRPA